MENTLMKYDAKLRNWIDFLQAIPDVALWITDKDGNIEYVNDFACKMIGKEFKELARTNIIERLKDNKYTEEYYNHMCNMVLEGKVFNSEFPFKNKSGKISWAGITIVPYIKGDKVEKLVAFGTDITKARYDKIKLKAILDSAPDIILIFDKNRKLIEHYGKDVLDIGGEKFHQKIIQSYKENVKKLNDIFDKIDENYDEQDFSDFVSYPIYDKEKNVMIFEAKGKRLNSDKYLVFVRDITISRQAKALSEFQSSLRKLFHQNRNTLQNLYYLSEFTKNSKNGLSK